MKDMFSMESPLFRMLSTLYDLIILNLLTLLFCLPVITAGASLTAMHCVLIQLVRDEETYIARGFLRAFRENLRQSTLAWGGFLLLFLGCFLLMQSADGTAFQDTAFIFTGVVLILLFLLSLYLFPLLARFRNTLPRAVLLSAALTAAYLFRTAGMAVIHVLCAGGLTLFLPRTVPLVVLFGLSLPGYFCALLYNPVLTTLERRADGGTDT